MIYIFNYLSVFAFIFAFSFSVQTDNAASVTIEVKGVKNNQGNIRVAIFRDPASFPKGKPFMAQLKAAHESGTVALTFEDVPYGEYAIAVYHDANENGELDTNFMGIPKEAYGFSNDHRPKFSGPDFEAAKVEINQAQVNLDITIEEF